MGKTIFELNTFSSTSKQKLNNKRERRILAEERQLKNNPVIFDKSVIFTQ